MFQFVLFFILAGSITSQAESPKLTLDATMASLYKMIAQAQNENHLHPRYLGLWPATIETLESEHREKRAEDYNIFVGLQTMLLLNEVHSAYELPNFYSIDKIFTASLNQYVVDTIKSKRQMGSIAFWPYLKTDQGFWLHNFTTDNESLKVTANVDLPNDLDDSAHAAMFYLQKGTRNEFLKDYYKMLPVFQDQGSGGFWTWVKNEPHKNNSVDCIVNINILSSVQAAIKVGFGNKEIQDVAISARKSTQYLEEIISNKKIHQCAIYYSRPSQLLLAMAKLYHLGGGFFHERTYSLIRNLLWKELSRDWILSPYSLTELSELLISFNLLYSKESADIPTRAMLDVKSRLKAKLLDDLSFLNNANSQSQNLGDLFLGNFGENLGWFSKAQTATLILYFLSLEAR